VNLSARRQWAGWILLGCLLTLGACDLNPHHVDRITPQTYQCNGADPLDSHSACNREPQAPPH
jgi:hypothetical protein